MFTRHVLQVGDVALCPVTRHVLQFGDVALCRVGMMTGKETVVPIETPTAIPTKTCHDKIRTLKVANVTA